MSSVLLTQECTLKLFHFHQQANLSHTEKVKSIPDWIVEGQRVQQQHLSLLKARREQSLRICNVFIHPFLSCEGADNTVSSCMNPKKKVLLFIVIAEALSECKLGLLA